MKLTGLFILAACLHVSASGFGQNITLSVKNAPLKKVFDEIIMQSGTSIIYNDVSLKNARPITIEVKNATPEQVLDLCLKGQPFAYFKEDGLILIKPVPLPDIKQEPGNNGPRLFVIYPPTITVKGRIVDEKGEPVIASVIIKKTKRGTTTNGDGFFELKNVDDNAVLMISGANIESQEVLVFQRSYIEITVKLKIEIEKQVIIDGGYYKTTARDKTGSISKVTSKEIGNQPVTSPMMALQGRVPGLDITPTSGVPGAAVKVRIRGQNSLRGEDYPLYVIDGIPIDSRPLQVSEFGSRSLLAQGLDPLSTIDPDNIESIEVLKDADATAIYGSRGANGVILVTTKRAKRNDDLSTSFSAYHGIGQIPNRLDLLNREQYLSMRREAMKNDGLTPRWFDHDINGNWDTTRSTDWQDLLMGETANTTDVKVGISSGGQQTSFDLSMSYHKETLILPGDFGSTQLAGLFSMNHRSKNNRLSLTLSAQYSNNKGSHGGDLNLVGQALMLPPNAPALFNEDGSLNWQIVKPFNNDIRIASFQNPFAALLRTSKSNYSSLFLSANLSYNIFPGLNVNVSSGTSNGLADAVEKSPITSGSPTYLNPTASAMFNTNRRSTWVIEPSLNYRKILADHSFNAVVGATVNQIYSEYNGVRGSGYTSDALLNSIVSAPYKYYSVSDEMYRYMAAYARVGYDYKGKYIVNFTGRRDGSSRFGPGKRISNFGSIGAAWILSDESFLRNSSFIDFAKIRGSIGVTGSENIGSYRFMETYDISEALYQGMVVLNPSSLYNDDLAWEKNKKTELGLELGFFNNALSMEIAAYRNISSNQLVSYGLPYISGFPSVDLNLDAVIQNTGMEFYITTRNIRRDNFQWTTTANLTVRGNKLKRYDNIENSSYAKVYQVGKPLGIQWIYKWKGVNPETGEDIFQDTDGDGEITDEDRVFARPLNNGIYGGINNSFVFKNFELSFFFQFANQIQSGHFYSVAGESGNKPLWVLDRWTESKRQASLSKFTTQGYLFSSLLQMSDFNTKETWLLRLNTLSLKYRLPGSFLKSVHMKSGEVFLQGQNLFYFSNYKMVLDPQTGNTLPQLRIISAGLNVKF